MFSAFANAEASARYWTLRLIARDCFLYMLASRLPCGFASKTFRRSSSSVYFYDLERIATLCDANVALVQCTRSAIVQALLLGGIIDSQSVSSFGK